MSISLKTIKRKWKIQEMIGTTGSKGYHNIEANEKKMWREMLTTGTIFMKIEHNWYD